MDLTLYIMNNTEKDMVDPLQQKECRSHESTPGARVTVGGARTPPNLANGVLISKRSIKFKRFYSFQLGEKRKRKHTIAISVSEHGTCPYCYEN